MNASPYRHTTALPDLGGAIRALRKERGLTQEQLADLVRQEGDPIGPQMVRHYEAGRRVPEWARMVAISRALGIGMAVLMFRAEQLAKEAQLQEGAA